MEQKIIQALQAIHAALQLQAAKDIPYTPTSLADILEYLGFPRDSVPVGFHDALEKLEVNGQIYDHSTANAGFGRSRGVDGDMAYSNGAKVTLCK